MQRSTRQRLELLALRARAQAHRLASGALVLLALLALQGPLRADANAPWEPPRGDDLDALLDAHVRPDGRPSTWRASYGSYVVRSDVGRRFALEAVLYLARFEEQFRAIFGLGGTGDSVLCVIYAEERDYRRSFDDGSRGQYRRRERVLYSYLDRGRGETGWADFYKPILLHEAAHQLLQAVTRRGDLPVWFDEGIATAFQAWNVQASLSTNLDELSRRSYRAEELREAWREKRLVPLSRLIRLDREAWTCDHHGPLTRLHYAEAGSFVGFLLSSREGRATFRALYEVATSGGDPTDYVHRRRGSLARRWSAALEERFGPPPAPEDR